MLSCEDNDLLTRTGAGTPMGDLMRRYWIPALLSKQLSEPDCAPVRVQLMGGKLVAFRDSKGRLGLLDEHCPHRTASLFFGRNEEGGLRCVYHGWKFDVDGNCVDMPNEPHGSKFQSKVRTNAYPCLERGGIIWTYLGPPEKKPDFPDLIWTQIPDSHLYVTRRIQECNWLQALEGGFDTSHLSFLHTGTAARLEVPSQYPIVPIEGGFIAGTGREVKEGETSWTSNLMFMPFHKVFATSPEAAHVWVPIDDETTMLYSADYWVDRPLTDEDLKRTTDFHGIHTENISGTDRAAQNKDNDFLIDRDLQKSGKSYTGMRGLGVQDSAIIQIRKILLQSVKDLAACTEPPGLDPKSYRVRSRRFTLPHGEPFESVIAQHLANPNTLDSTKLGVAPLLHGS